MEPELTVSLQPIGYVESCYPEKFGIPRQPGIVADAPGQVILYPHCAMPESVRGLEQFSHIWLLSWLHECAAAGWNPTVRPPRLGGNQRTGVFGSRSPFRPNPIGLSLVELRCVDTSSAGGTRLVVRGLDLLDGTPILDLKPYVPYADSRDGARAGFATDPPVPTLEVAFSAEADRACTGLEGPERPRLRQLITRTVASDPRPAYQARSNESRDCWLRLFDLHISFRVQAEHATIVEIGVEADKS